MDFRSHYDPRPVQSSCVGSRYHTTYSGRYNDQGQVELVESGKVDIYDEIQSHKDSVDINVILRRYRNGETDILERVQGAFLDVTDQPKTFADMLNLVNSSRSKFDSLPVDVRAKFNHNFVQFMDEYGSNAWLDKMGYKSAAVVDHMEESGLNES